MWLVVVAIVGFVVVYATGVYFKAVEVYRAEYSRLESEAFKYYHVWEVCKKQNFDLYPDVLKRDAAIQACYEAQFQYTNLSDERIHARARQEAIVYVQKAPVVSLGSWCGDECRHLFGHFAENIAIYTMPLAIALAIVVVAFMITCVMYMRYRMQEKGLEHAVAREEALKTMASLIKDGSITASHLKHV